VPQLPFVVAPKRETRLVSAVVNDETCSLEFPVYGCILAGEDIAIRDHEYQAAVYRESSRLADALLADGLNEADAQRIAIRILSTRMGIPVPLDDPEQRLMIRHPDLIASLQSTLAEEYQRQVVRTATAAIAHRLPDCQDWSEADTEGLPLPLQIAIANFIDDERRGKAPAKSPEELVAEMAETLGKLESPSDPEAPSPSPSTGPASTGAAAGSGPPPQSSVESDSHASPSATSTKRSRKVKAG
jgi:hypothetical protein